MKKTAVARITHGQTVDRTRGAKRTAEYVAWESMQQRCYDPAAKNFKDYGGRGITVCARWRGPSGFAHFIADVGPRPSCNHSLDRTDNNRGYESGNVRWATKKEQQRNRRSNKRLTVNGETLCIVEWAERLGCSPSAIHDRLEDGWPPARAVTTPVKKYRARNKEERPWETSRT